MLCFVLEKILTHVKQVVQSGPAFCSCSKYLYDTLINSDARKSKSCSKKTRKTHSGTSHSNSRHLEARLNEVGLVTILIPRASRGGKMTSLLPSLICINFPHRSEARDLPKHGFGNRNGSTRISSGNICLVFFDV